MNLQFGYDYHDMSTASPCGFENNKWQVPKTMSPQEIIDQQPMSRMQIVAVIMCIFLFALDGFDVLAISFAAPGISTEWNVDRAALGVILAMELIGMGVGSVVLGNMADRIGRRPVALVCLSIMSLGMLLAGMASDVTTLSAYRLFTGFGIGGMLATANAMVAEYANMRRRNLAVICLGTGFPIGAILGGSVASVLLETQDWRSVFMFGAIITVAFIPLVWFFLPETVLFLARKRGTGALEKINHTLKRMGHSVVDKLDEVQQSGTKFNKMQLFSPELLRTTLLLTAGYFFHVMTFYFIIKWIPKIVVDMGFDPSTAGTVLVWANVGGLLGTVLLALASGRFSLRYLVVIAMLGSFLMVGLFGQGFSTIRDLSLIAAAAGFFTSTGIVGFYALNARMFPTEVRAGGTGFVIGIGRGGSALGPILAGFLFASGQDLQTVALTISIGSLLAAGLVLMLSAQKSEQEALAQT